MKTVKEYKSLPINKISNEIVKDSRSLFEDFMVRQLASLGYPDPNDNHISYNTWLEARSYSWMLTAFRLETLLTIALMELAHKETVGI